MRPSPALARLKIRTRREQSPFGPFTSRRVRFSPKEDRPRSLSRQWNFDHLVNHRVPPTVKGSSSRLPSGTERIREFVHFDDRIKFWNITAGDRVIVADGPPGERGKIRHVAWTDRTRNHIGLFEEDCRVSLAHLRGSIRR